MESNLNKNLSIMVSNDSNTIDFLDAETVLDGPFSVTFNGTNVQCVKRWRLSWTRGTPLTFPTKNNPGWYYDILRQYTRISGASAGGFSFRWDKNDLPWFTFPADTSLADQTAFRNMVWTKLFDAAMEALTQPAE